MRVVESFPYKVREIEHEWIPLADGCRLSARIWLPEGAGPVPAIIEYIPYRKRDDTRWRDEPIHGYFAGHGYAALRIDVRGSGASDGVLHDEYSEEEWHDGLAALEWIAAQSWCDGRIGLMGKSWGGINALQIAALQPPELRCVISVCSSDDRWATDAHWMGGCLLSENLTWGSVLQTIAVRPQDPELVGGAWRENWIRRMEEAPVYATRWLRHATRDEYWARGSVADDYGRIRVPVLAVGGWADAYADTVPRLLEGLGPRARGWVGPWAHVYPHHGAPGPAVGFLQVALAWWDRWLRDRAEPGAEPAYRVWMPEGRPGVEPAGMPRGRWVSEDGWPSGRTVVESHPLGEAGSEERAVPWTAAGGVAAGAWCAFGLDDLPGEQAPDDAESAVFDLAPLSAPLEVLGAPEVELVLSCDRPFGMVAVRLCDVAPDGTSQRVSYGLLDLSFRNGFQHRERIVPGESYAVRVPLRHCAHSFARGHRVRVAVSTSYWPVVWPLPQTFGLSVEPSRSLLRLPVRPPRADDALLQDPPPPEAAPSSEEPEDVMQTREVFRDPASGTWRAIVRQGWGPDGEPALSPVEPIGLESGWGIEERLEVDLENPMSARATIRHVAISQRGGWSARVEVTTEQGRTQSGFWLRCEIVGSEGGRVLCRREVIEHIDGPHRPE